MTARTRLTQRTWTELLGRATASHLHQHSRATYDDVIMNDIPYGLPPNHPARALIARSRQGAQHTERCIKLVHRMLQGKGIRHHATVQATSGTGFDPGQSSHDFHKAASGIVGENIEDFRPGCVLNVTIQEPEASLFASVFIESEAKVIRGRLVRLANRLPCDEQGRPHNFRAEHESPLDRVVEEIDMAYSEPNVDASAQRLADWLLFNIELELGRRARRESQSQGAPR